MPEYDEPDLRKHIANVLKDYAAGQLDGIDEAVEAIMDRPELGLVEQLRQAMRQYLPPDSEITAEQFASEIIGLLDHGLVGIPKHPLST